MTVETRPAPRAVYAVPRRQWLWLTLLFVVSLPAVTTRIYSSDEIQYFAYLRSVWFDRDLAFENEYRYFYDHDIARAEGFHETFLERTTDTGRRINFATVGCAILWAPFYAAGDLTARLAGAPVDGFSKPYIAAVAYASALYGFLAVVLSIHAAARLRLPGVLPGLAVWLGTPLLFYMYVAPPFSHATSAFSVALFVWVWLRVRERWSPAGLAALGACAALMAMVREQDAFVAAGPALDYLWTAARDRRLPASAIAGIAGAAVCFALVYVPQIAAYLIVNGHIGPHASVGRKMNWFAPHALQVLFSPEHGFFVWTPLAGIALAGLVVLVRRSETRQIAACLLVIAVLQVYVGGSVESWTVAGAFGQRRFIALTSLMTVGLAAIWAAVSTMPGRALRTTAAVIVAVTVYWNVALSAEFAIPLMDRQKLEPARNARDAVLTLPALLPSLLYRYVFDRPSFYKHGS